MNNNILSKSFLWMFIGLLVTFVTGYAVCTNYEIMYAIFAKNGYIFLMIAELILVIFLSARIFKMKPTTAKIMFLLYSFVSGLTFSSIFFAFELSFIMYVFLIAAAVFGLFGFLGFTTKIDLSKIGTFLMMGLLGVVICSIVNIFIGGDAFSLIISIISLIVFLGITAFDVQKIKNLPIDNDNGAIYGALQLYLDFINIFLDLLRILSRNRD